MPFSIADILEATSGRLIRGKAEGRVVAISTDTREPQGGKLFVPLKGERFDAHAFLATAVRNGAQGVLIGKGERGRLKDLEGNSAIIEVGDTLAALGDIAHFWRKKFTIPVVAITGSAGKTTTKEMTTRILERIGSPLQTGGNYNNLIGLPLTLLKLKAEHDVAILEMGTNVPGEIARLSEIADPGIGLITNIGPAHLEGLKTVALVKEEKGQLFQHVSKTGTMIVNIDDLATNELASEHSGACITYGLRPGAEVTAEEITDDAAGLNFVLKMGDDRGRVVMTAPGMHNLQNALAAAALNRALGTDPAAIRAGLGDFTPVAGRMEIKALGNGAFLIDDSYNANPLSVEKALLTLRALRKGHPGVVVLGDMLELGDEAARWHEETGALIAATGATRVYLHGKYASSTAVGALGAGYPAAAILTPSKLEETAADLATSLQEGDWLLVKGSRAMKMEEVVRILVMRFGLV